MSQGSQDQRGMFSTEFDDSLPVGPAAENTAFFGLNVLQGLVDGIDDFIHKRQPRWNRWLRSLGPAVLGCAMWADDDELINKISELSAACVVITRQGHDNEKLKRLADLNKRTPGMPVDAFSSLTDLAPSYNGKPAIVGPSTPPYRAPIPTFRALGFRRGRSYKFPPILHAKLALIGELWWHDEDELGGVADVIGFEAIRLWVSSASFTASAPVTFL